jgi:DNA-binding transcriptional ArsR family regulator
MRGDAQVERVAAVANAMRHPLRAAIIGLLQEGERSPADLAAELDANIGNVSYHVACLRDAGFVRLTRTAPVRGALQHFYIATVAVSIEARNGTVTFVVKERR